MTFLARGVWGSLPMVTMSGPLLTSFSTSRRTLRRSTSTFFITFAPTPDCRPDYRRQVYGHSPGRFLRPILDPILAQTRRGHPVPVRVIGMDWSFRERGPSEDPAPSKLGGL